MGQILHGSATTTEAIRRAIQRSEASVRGLARRHGISAATVQKWRKRETVADARMGPKQISSSVLTAEQEAMIVAFRRHTLLSLDDCLYALQPSIPCLTRSSLHRCLQRHGISRLPLAGSDGPGKKRFKAYPIGYFHIDIAEVRTEQGKLHLFVAIDRTSKLAFAQLHEKATRQIAADFLHDLVNAVPYRIHTLLTDNGVQFAHTGPEECSDEDTPTSWIARQQARTGRCHAFGYACEKHGIEHRLTRPYHPWTNGQVERMNRTLKEATVQRYHYTTHDDLRMHVQLFLDAYNHARRLKALRGLTPYEFTCHTWTSEPERFRIEPSHHTPGLNTVFNHQVSEYKIARADARRIYAEYLMRCPCRRNRETGHWESVYLAGRSDVALVRSLRDGRLARVAVRTLIVHEDEGLRRDEATYPTRPNLRLYRLGRSRGPKSRLAA